MQKDSERGREMKMFSKQELHVYEAELRFTYQPTCGIFTRAHMSKIMKLFPLKLNRVALHAVPKSNFFLLFVVALGCS